METPQDELLVGRRRRRHISPACFRIEPGKPDTESGQDTRVRGLSRHSGGRSLASRCASVRFLAFLGSLVTIVQVAKTASQVLFAWLTKKERHLRPPDTRQEQHPDCGSDKTERQHRKKRQQRNDTPRLYQSEMSSCRLRSHFSTLGTGGSPQRNDDLGLKYNPCSQPSSIPR